MRKKKSSYLCETNEKGGRRYIDYNFLNKWVDTYVIPLCMDKKDLYDWVLEESNYLFTALKMEVGDSRDREREYKRLIKNLIRIGNERRPDLPEISLFRKIKEQEYGNSQPHLHIRKGN